MSRRDAIGELAHALDMIGLAAIVDFDHEHALAITCGGDAFLIELAPEIAAHLVGASLRQLGGAWSVAEIAARMNMSATDVRRHERRGLVAARVALADHAGPGAGPR